MIPVVEKMEVYPVAGHDCMELNLSGAHAPYFTRNIVILTDSAGTEGVGEVPGGEKITKALEQVKDLVIGTSIADYKQTLNKVRGWLDKNIKDDVRGLQTFDLRTGVHVVTAVKRRFWIFSESFLRFRHQLLWETESRENGYSS